MVSCILTGGAANLAFQVMTTYAYSRKHNMRYAIPTRTSNPRWKHYRFGKVNYQDCDTKNLFHYKSPDIFYDNRPYDVSYHEIPYRQDILLEGHFQSWKYWIDYIDEIRDLFNFRYEFKEDTVAVHKRMGDYLTMVDKLPPVTPSYIANAINHFAEQGYKKFLLFSDDQETFKKEIHILLMSESIRHGLRIEFSEGKTDMEDLALMSSCAHQVCANSSYSLLSYYLNRNPNKLAICPRQWFGIGYGTVNVNDIYPQNALIL